jgi:hypothetical protein
MLEAMAALILAIVGAMLIIIILSYGVYVTFYSLNTTVSGIEGARGQASEAKEQRLQGRKMPESIVAKYA